MAENHNRYWATENGKLRHREHMRGYMKIYRERQKLSDKYNPDEERRKWREQHTKVREKAMDLLGGRLCANCGCNEFSILEINHINGGGRKELKLRKGSNRQLYHDIVNDRVNLNEYNVLCRVCNALHYVNEILALSDIKLFGEIA